MAFPTGINPAAGVNYQPSTFQQPAEKGWNSVVIVKWSEFYGNYFFDCETVDSKKVTISLRIASENEIVRQDACGKAARLTYLYPNWTGDLTPSRIGEFVGMKLDVNVTHSYTCKCASTEKYNHNAEDSGKECALCGSKVFTNAEERGELEPYQSKSGNGAARTQQQQSAQHPAQQQQGDGWNAPQQQQPQQQQPQQPQQQPQQQQGDGDWPAANETPQQQQQGPPVPF